MSHYFKNDESLKSEKRIIKYAINSFSFELVSDLGVFSKNELDPGSELLIKNAIILDPDKDINAKKDLLIKDDLPPLGFPYYSYFYYILIILVFCFFWKTFVYFI